MNQVVPILAARVSALTATGGEKATYRFFEFFAANIRNPHTRRVYVRVPREFFDRLATQGVLDLMSNEACMSLPTPRS